MTSFHVIIPARMASSRLPGKMLADVAGHPLVIRTAQQAAKAQPSSLTIATDDQAILQAVHSYGYQGVMTDLVHLTGTDRLAQAVDLMGLSDESIVVNVQGDEPLIEPALIRAVALELALQNECVMATASHAIHAEDEVFNPNVVKVVSNHAGQALYFSRAPIPYARDGFAQHNGGRMACAYKSDFNAPAMARHIGIYAYRARFLRQYPQLGVSPLENTESLEQLRVLWHGHKIAVHHWGGPLAPGVDTAADLARLRGDFTL